MDGKITRGVNGYHGVDKTGLSQHTCAHIRQTREGGGGGRTLSLSADCLPRTMTSILEETLLILLFYSQPRSLTTTHHQNDPWQ